MTPKIPRDAPAATSMSLEETVMRRRGNRRRGSSPCRGRGSSALARTHRPTVLSPPALTMTASSAAMSSAITLPGVEADVAGGIDGAGGEVAAVPRMTSWPPPEVTLPTCDVAARRRGDRLSEVKSSAAMLPPAPSDRLPPENRLPAPRSVAAERLRRRLPSDCRRSARRRSTAWSRSAPASPCRR